MESGREEDSKGTILDLLMTCPTCGEAEMLMAIRKDRIETGPAWNIRAPSAVTTEDLAICFRCSAGHHFSIRFQRLYGVVTVSTYYAQKFAYEEYLKSPEWAARREKALVSAGRRCQLCNGTNSLNVHHRTYERIGREKPEDLTVLCRSCHAKFHDKPE